MRSLKRNVKAVFDDNEYINDMQRRKAYLDEMKAAINSPFGVMLLKALDDVEATAFNTLYKSSFKHRVAQAKAEIKVASYLKGVIKGYASEAAAFEDAVARFQDMEYGEEQ